MLRLFQYKDERSKIECYIISGTCLFAPWSSHRLLRSPTVLPLYSCSDFYIFQFYHFYLSLSGTIHSLCKNRSAGVNSTYCSNLDILLSQTKLPENRHQCDSWLQKLIITYACVLQTNIISTFTKMQNTIGENYDTDDRLLIGCPSPEQITVLLSSTILSKKNSIDASNKGHHW